MGEHEQLTVAARTVLPQFGVPADAELTILAAGHNHVFRVDHGARRLVLRVRSDQRLSDAAQRLQLIWLTSIRDEVGICVPRPVRTVAGEWFVRIEPATDRGPWRCVLLEWVEGE